MDIVQVLEVVLLATLLICWYLLGTGKPPWNKLNAIAKTRAKNIPGPWALPILGTSWVYSRLGGYNFSQVHTFYADMLTKHGRILKEEALWNIPVISVFGRQDIEKVLKSSGKFPIRPPTEAIAHYRRNHTNRYASTGIVNEQGEKWYHLRSNLTSNLTSAKTIASYLPELEHIADDFCTLLSHSRTDSNEVLEVENLASRLGLEAICCLVLGRRMGFLTETETRDAGNESARSLQSRLAVAVANHFVACRDTYYGLPLWKLFPTPAYRKLAHSEEEIYTLVSEIVHSAQSPNNAITSAIFQSVLGADVDEREKTAAIVDFIAAGIYTMRNSLVFLLDLIARNENVHEKLLQDDDYLRACINESFRLMPTAICLARVTQEELLLSGYKVPVGSVVLAQTGLACRDEANFYQPNDFIPERWLDERKQATSSAATFLVIPFGAGRRTCPGKRFIEQSLPVIIRKIVEKFVPKVTTRALQVQFEFLLAPKAPVSMIFEER